MPSTATKKIAYIEIDTHAEIAMRFKELMQDSQQFSVDYYFSERICHLLQCTPAVPNIFQVNPDTLWTTLSQHEYDGVIIGTMHRYFNLFNAVTQRYRTGIIGHNFNFIKASNLQLLGSVFKKERRYRLKLLLKEGLLLKNKVYRQAHQIWSLDENLTAVVQPELPLFFTKNDLKLPKAAEERTIVIAGSVSQGRRDYQAVIEQLSGYQGRFLRVVFLGKAAGQELRWLQDLQKQKAETLDLVFFTEKVPQSIFDEWMARAQLLWSPIHTHTAFMSIPEIYGQTKMSGNQADGITYHKKTLTSKNLSQVLAALEEGNSQPNEKVKSKEKVLKNLEKTLIEFCK
ncbi:hypothetical protein [Riemerella columbina]|uniref:hypothetical protein n=1 Tax=Riemerella columbina TaxID=103810 RepID=UPI00266F6023|nr:hypothetical protein [Riemerella columbina]WKS94696.1 hypothetical protein NYR17_07110 [Riemerella columbina]